MPEQIRPDLALLEVAQKDTVHTPRQPRTLPARTRSRAMRTTTAFFAGAGTIAVAACRWPWRWAADFQHRQPPRSQAGRGTKQGGTANDGSRSGSKRRIRIFVLYRGDTGGGNQTRHRQPCATSPLTKPGNNRLSRKRNKPTLRRFPTRSLPRPRRKPLPVSHPQPLTMRSPGRAILTSNASCAVPRNSARPNAASNGWRSAATAVAGMTSFAMSN